MRYAIFSLIAVGALASAGASSPAQFGGRPGRNDPAARYGWLSSLEAGKAQARKSGKPLMVVFRCVP